LERHRFSGKYISSQPWLTKNSRILHFAPEECISLLLKNISGNNYVSADIKKGRAMLAEDITKLSMPDMVFDFIYCSHVMEHIVDDHKAFSEIHRVLAHNGKVLFMVPINGDSTKEDPSVLTDEDRLRVYGQHDHVRIYGKMDFADRMKKVGFDVEIIQSSSVMSKEEMNFFGIKNTCVFVGTKLK